MACFALVAVLPLPKFITFPLFKFSMRPYLSSSIQGVAGNAGSGGYGHDFSILTHFTCAEDQLHTDISHTDTP